MLALLSGVIWAGFVIYLLSRALRQFRTYRRASLSVSSGSRVSPAVSIIVPVRNEIANIGRCLAGLSTQTCLSGRSSIIIVDDDSQDGTQAAVEYGATADPRIKLVAAGTLPAGWVGKPHACWCGALLAEGDWLCFVDADVHLAPGLVAAAVTTAEGQGIDMLSLHPLQELGSFWERVVMPAGLLVLACAKRFEPETPDVVNGQFLLIRREAYFQVGGHSAVHAEICEDKALATRVKAAGFTLQVLAAEHLASTRMYRDLHSLWEGLSKNATDALGSIRATLVAAAAAFVFGWTALLLPLVNLLAAFAEPSPAAMVASVMTACGTGIVIAIHCGTARHFRIPAVFGLTFTLGYTAVACLACHGVMAQLNGRVTWKGRIYQLTKTSPGRA